MCRYPHSQLHAHDLVTSINSTKSCAIWERHLRTPRRVGSPCAQWHTRSLPIEPRVPFSTLIHHPSRDRSLVEDAQLLSCETNHLRRGPEPPLPSGLVRYHGRFDLSFEDGNSIEGMKKLIVEEVCSFRAEVGAHDRAAGQVRRQGRWIPFYFPFHVFRC